MRLIWTRSLVLLGCAGGVLLLASEPDVPTGTPTGLAFAVFGLLLSPAWSMPVLLVSAHSVDLLTEDALGAISPVDAAVLAVTGRVIAMRFGASIAVLRTPAVLGAGCFVVVGAIATATSPEDAAVTAFLRVAAYLALGVALIAALTRDERQSVLTAIVGVAIGDAVGALTGLTGRLAGGLGEGRYLGTLGDPAQFGIPIALALLVVLCAGWRLGIPSRSRWFWRLSRMGVRLALAALLAAALIGSETRSAFLAGCVGAIGVLGLVGIRLGFSPRTRFSVGVLVGAVAVVAAAGFALGAEDLGFDPVSARIRIESLEAAGDYLIAHPLRPTGLGNLPGQFPAYNTWVAMSVALTPLAALGLAVFIGSGVVRAWRLGHPEWLAATLGFVGATLTENIVFAGSSLTLSWFILTGLVLGYAANDPEPEHASSAPP